MSVPSFFRKGWYGIRAIWLSVTITHRPSVSICRHLWRVCYSFSYNVGWPMSKTSNYNIGLKITSSIIDIKRQHQHLHHWHQDISPSHNHALSCSGEALSQYCWRWGFLTSFSIDMISIIFGCFAVMQYVLCCIILNNYLEISSTYIQLPRRSLLTVCRKPHPPCRGWQGGWDGGYKRNLWKSD